MGRHKLVSGLFSCALAGLAGGVAHAQPPRAPGATPTPQELNPNQQLPGAAQARRPADIFQRPEPGPCPIKDSEVPFELKSVTFTGLTGVNEKALEKAYRNEIGKKATVAEICEIRDRVSTMLFDRGIFARVEIPPQTVTDGRLTLQVIEARVVNIRFHGDAGPAEAKVEAYIERLRGMKPFDLTKAERYLLLANDVPGVQVSAAVRPSGEAPGAVDLDITAVRVSPFNVAVAANNLGSQSLGPWSGLVRGDLNSMTPFGDRTSAVVYTTFDGKEQQVVQLLSEARPTSTGLKVNGSVSYAHTQPGGALTALHLDGDAVDASFGASYPLIHSRSKDLSLGAGFELADQHTVFASGGVLIDDKLRIVYLSADGALNKSLFGVPYRATLELQYRKGLSVFGASRTGLPTLSRASGIPTADVGRANGRLEILPFRKLDLDVEVMAQYSASPLLSYEQISIGNLTIGRGYDPSTVTGDRGVAFRFEPVVGPFNLPLGQMFSVFGFYDQANTEFVDIGQKLNVRSAGAGLRLRPQRPDQRGFALDVMYADPLDKISPAALSKPPARALVSVTYRY